MCLLLSQALPEQLPHYLTRTLSNCRTTPDETLGRCVPAGAGGRGSDATEAYWALLERMRREYLADLEAAYDVYLGARAQHPPGSPALAHVDKLAGIRPILPRLQVRSPSTCAKLCERTLFAQ